MIAEARPGFSGEEGTLRLDCCSGQRLAPLTGCGLRLQANLFSRFRAPAPPLPLNSTVGRLRVTQIP